MEKYKKMRKNSRLFVLGIAFIIVIFSLNLVLASDGAQYCTQISDSIKAKISGFESNSDDSNNLNVVEVPEEN